MNDLTCSSLSSMKCLCLRIALRFSALPNISAEPPHSHRTNTHTHRLTHAQSVQQMRKATQRPSELFDAVNIWNWTTIKKNRDIRGYTVGPRRRADPVDRSSWLSRGIRRARSETCSRWNSESATCKNCLICVWILVFLQWITSLHVTFYKASRHSGQLKCIHRYFKLGCWWLNVRFALQCFYHWEKT